MRRTLGYFIQNQFSPDAVIERLHDFGFSPNNHVRVVVTWGWTPEARRHPPVLQSGAGPQGNGDLAFAAWIGSVRTRLQQGRLLGNARFHPRVSSLHRDALGSWR
jgi:hypothetical protein